MSVTLPGPDKRLAIVGSTGSGKTFAGVWHLSVADFHLRPWIIIDFKRDKLLSQLGATEISFTGKVPAAPGLYIIRPIPERDDDLVREFLWKIWAQENVGVYTDEGYMLGNRNPALNALLTQGRSKHIQMITLSQRPVWMSRFVFSESDYFQVFRLNDRRDYDSIQAMISLDIRKRLPPYHSHWYDVGADEGATFGPVPNREQLIRTFHTRIKHKLKVM